jgi:hypothetical protein
MGEAEVPAYLTHLTSRGRVAHSTQIQAVSALLFLYRDVLHRPLGNLRGLVRASGPRRLPVVLTAEEVARRTWISGGGRFGCGGARGRGTG